MAPDLLNSGVGRRWAAAGLACLTAFALGSCILPPPIDPVAEFGNQPPRVIPSGIFPDPVQMPILLSEQCTEPQVFNLFVEDGDENDTIFWRVFVDYSANPFQYEEFADFIDQREVTPGNADADGRRQLRFELEATDLRFSSGINRFNTGHVVEVVVSDRLFSDDPLSARDPAVEVAQTAIWAWTVNLTDGPCPVGN